MLINFVVGVKGNSGVRATAIIDIRETYDFVLMLVVRHRVGY